MDSTPLVQGWHFTNVRDLESGQTASNFWWFDGDDGGARTDNANVEQFLIETGFKKIMISRARANRSINEGKDNNQKIKILEERAAIYKHHAVICARQCLRLIHLLMYLPPFDNHGVPTAYNNGPPAEAIKTGMSFAEAWDRVTPLIDMMKEIFDEFEEMCYPSAVSLKLADVALKERKNRQKIALGSLTKK